MYVTFVDGNMMRSKDIRKAALHQVFDASLGNQWGIFV